MFVLKQNHRSKEGYNSFPATIKINNILLCKGRKVCYANVTTSKRLEHREIFNYMSLTCCLCKDRLAVDAQG